MQRQNPEITVIVPAYNAAGTLEACAQSLAAQTGPGFEVILVNDGSTDGTAALCDAWAQKDARFTALHQPNGGVSSARNLGLSHAHGKKLCFVDADDTVTQDYLAALNTALGEMDLAICGFWQGAPGRWKKALPPAVGEIAVDTIKKDAATYGNNLVLYSPVNKLYRTALVCGEPALCFDPAYKIGEDWKFNLAYFERCETVALLAAPLYYNTDHPDRATRREQPLFEEHNRLLARQTADFFCGMENRPDVALYVLKHWVYVLGHQMKTLPKERRRAARRRILADDWYRGALAVLQGTPGLGLPQKLLCFALRHRLLYGWMFSPGFSPLTSRLAHMAGSNTHKMG